MSMSSDIVEQEQVELFEKIRQARLGAFREVREMLEAERAAMNSRQAAFERMGNDDAVRDLSKDIADQTRRIVAIGQMEEESRI
jgi:hypothetical protein